jgi:hypothetical protein
MMVIYGVLAVAAAQAWQNGAPEKGLKDLVAYSGDLGDPEVRLGSHDAAKQRDRRMRQWVFLCFPFSFCCENFGTFSSPEN